MAVDIKEEGLKAKWTAFVTALGKTEEEVATALKGELGDTVNDAAVANLGDADITPDADLLAALTGAGVAKATARAAIKGIRNAPVVTPVAPAAGETGARGGVSLLISVGDDTSILDLLRVGGVAKMTAEDLVAAVRAAYTRAVGVDQIIPTLLRRMKEHAESLDEPLGPTYFKLLKASRRRQYADVLAAFDGAISSVPEDEKEKFLNKVDTLWPKLAAFQAQLDAYRQLHKDESADVGNIVAAIRGGTAAVDYPDVTPVIAAARGVIDAFNRVFGGMGIPAARALAKDITDEAELLRNPELPGTIGAGSFEEMVKKLGLGVPADARQIEVNIATFVLNLLKLPDQTSSQQPLVILELQRLGKGITTWPTGRTAPRTPAGGRAGREEPNRY